MAQDRSGLVASSREREQLDDMLLDQLVAAVEEGKRPGESVEDEVARLVRQMNQAARAKRLGLPEHAMSVEMVADIKRVSEKTVRRAIENGELKPLPVSGRDFQYFAFEAVEAWRPGPAPRKSRRH